MPRFNNAFFLPLLVISLGHFLVDMMIGIWPVYKTIVGLDLAIAGLISASCALMGEGLQILFGSLSDRGYRKTIIFGGLLASAASVFFVYTEAYMSLFALYLCTCIGSGAFHPSAVSVIADLPTERKSLVVATFTAAGALGMAFSQIIFTQTHFFSKDYVILLALPTALLVFLSLFNRVGSQAMRTPGEAKHHFKLKNILRFFREKELRMLYFTQISCATMFWGTMFLLPDVLSSRGYETWLAFGGGHMMFILGGGMMMIPAGYLADKFSSRSVILTSILTGMVLFYLFLMTPDMSNYNLMALLFGMGASIGIVNPVAVAMGTRLVPNQKGLVSAFLMGLVWCVSEGIGQAGGGFLTRSFTDDVAAKALAVLGVIFLLGIAAAAQLPQKEEALDLAEDSTFV